MRGHRHPRVNKYQHVQKRNIEECINSRVYVQTDPGEFAANILFFFFFAATVFTTTIQKKENLKKNIFLKKFLEGSSQLLNRFDVLSV